MNTFLTKYWLGLIALTVGLSFRISAHASTNSSSDISIHHVVQTAQEFAKDNIDEELLKSLPNIDLGKISSWIKTQTETLGQIDNLESQLESDKKLLAEKRKLLVEIQQKINLLNLTTNQLAAVIEYNKSISKQPTFSEWIKESVTWFETGKDFVIAIVCFIFGCFFEYCLERRKKWTAKNLSGTID